MITAQIKCELCETTHERSFVSREEASCITRAACPRCSPSDDDPRWEQEEQVSYLLTPHTCVKSAEEAIEEIERIIEGIAYNWLASDGGLTAAGSDAVAFGQNLIKKLENGEIPVYEREEYIALESWEQDMVDCLP
jgi:hypothetical protein